MKPAHALTLLALFAAPAAAQEEAVPVMSDASFWSIVDASHRASSDPAMQAEWLRAVLWNLDAKTLVAFQNAYDHQVNLGFSYDVWDVGILIHGSMDEESFRPFRCWLVAQGHLAYAAALTEPDALAEVLPRDVSGPVAQERLCFVGAEAWANKTGATIDDIPIAEAAPTGLSGLPFGDDQDVAADAARHFPRLAARFKGKTLD